MSVRGYPLGVWMIGLCANWMVPANRPKECSVQRSQLAQSNCPDQTLINGHLDGGVWMHDWTVYKSNICLEKSCLSQVLHASRCICLLYDKTSCYPRLGRKIRDLSLHLFCGKQFNLVVSRRPMGQ